MTNHQIWIQNPTGKIPKGSFCSHCARFNVRNSVSDVIVLKDNKILLGLRAKDPKTLVVNARRIS